MSAMLIALPSRRYNGGVEYASRCNAFFYVREESRRERESCRLFIVSGGMPFEIPFPAATMIGPDVFKSFAFHYFLIARGFANILKVGIVLHTLPLVISLVNGFLEPST